MSQGFENATGVIRATMPRWWQSKRGMLSVILALAYVLLPALGKPVPDGLEELLRLIIVALFVSMAAGEKKE